MALRIEHQADKYQWKCQEHGCPKSRGWCLSWGMEHNDNFSDATVHCQLEKHKVIYRRTKEMVLHP